MINSDQAKGVVCQRARSSDAETPLHIFFLQHKVNI